MIMIFPKSKLESIDSILPLIYELKVNHNQKIFLIFQNEKDLEIIKKNIFIYDTLLKCAKIIVLKKKIFLLNKIRQIYFLFYFFFHNLISSKFIHFGFFDNGFFRYLNLLFSNNFFRAQSNSYFDNRRNLIKKMLIINEKLNFTYSKNIIALNEDFKNKISFKNKNIFFYTKPRLRNIWKNYTKKNSDYYFNKFHSQKKNQNNIFFAITSLHDQGFIRKGYSISIFKNIISSLRKNFPNHLILIKPHPTTNLVELNDLIKNEINIEITFLHPSIISRHSEFFICDLFSTVTTDAHFLGLTTIEYTIYDDKTLELIGKKSIGNEFVDYFIHEDVKELDDLFKKEFIKKNKIDFTEKSEDNKLINKLIL